MGFTRQSGHSIRSIMMQLSPHRVKILRLGADCVDSTLSLSLALSLSLSHSLPLSLSLSHTHPLTLSLSLSLALSQMEPGKFTRRQPHQSLYVLLRRGSVAGRNFSLSFPCSAGLHPKTPSPTSYMLKILTLYQTGRMLLRATHVGRNALVGLCCQLAIPCKFDSCCLRPGSKRTCGSRV